VKRLLLLFPALLAAIAARGATCESLAKFKLANLTVNSAAKVRAGDFPVPGASGPNAVLKALPEFCRVLLTLTPSSDSDIKVEVWLPLSGWNQKYEAVGNGGWAGVISYAAMGEALKRGYATSSTDTGHVGASGSFALGHPEKLADFGWRSEHEMAEKSKRIIAAFYGQLPKYSYWNGCSTGGRQGLKEVQRFPDDFQGVIAGAAASPRTGQAFEAMWIANAVLRDPASFIPPAKYPVIHKAVLDACDALDGVKDGVLDDPRKCHFDPSVLACRAGDAPDCLTMPQVEAVKKIYTPATQPVTDELLFPALMPGSELGWAGMAGGPEPNAVLYDHFKYVVFKDPNWDWKTLNFTTDVDLTRKADQSTITDGATIDATNPLIQSYLGHGKLILYHGWADQLVAAQASVRYYENVVYSIPGVDFANSLRLYMVPGMGHCGGGDGPNTFDMLTPLEPWVEHGKAPAEIVASHSTGGKIDRTRPLCPYPQVAKYKGTGSTDEVANFACTAP
jgi:feruloyl esterase